MILCDCTGKKNRHLVISVYNTMHNIIIYLWRAHANAAIVRTTGRLEQG